MTHNELHYFTHLGNMLGFLASREPERMDLCWRDFATNRLVLYLERENHSGKALNETLDKLLDPNLPDDLYLVGVFGWITKTNFDIAVQLISKEIGERNFLLIAFVGDNPNEAKDVQGIVWSGRMMYSRNAIADMDKAKYWYIYFPECFPGGPVWMEEPSEVNAAHV